MNRIGKRYLIGLIIFIITLTFVSLYIGTQKKDGGNIASTNKGEKTFTNNDLTSDNHDEQKVTGTVLGSWKDNDPVLPNIAYLVKEDGKILLKSVYEKSKYADAETIVLTLTKTTNNGLTRYNYQNKHQEYIQIEDNGNLGWYDNMGKIKELQKL